MKGNSLSSDHSRISCVLCALVLTLVLPAGHRVDASSAEAAQDGGPYSPAPAEQAADFDVLVELCSGGSQIVDELRRVMELDVCQVRERYDEIEQQYRRDQEDGQPVLEFLVSRLTSFSLQDLPWADLVARLAQRDANGHTYRVFASNIEGDVERRLRWTALLLLVDRVVDRDLVLRLGEGMALRDAVARALGSNGYAYVEPTGTPAGGWSEAAERRRAAGRAQGGLRGLGFALHVDSRDREYTTLNSVVVENPAVASDDLPERLEDLFDIRDLQVVPREDYYSRSAVFPVVPLLSYQYESVGDLVVEHGWEFSEDGGGGPRPLAGMVGALANHATQVLAHACEERLRTADQAWLHVVRAQNLPTALEDDEALWKAIFAEAMQGVEAGRECLGDGGIYAKFRAAFEATYRGRRTASLERLENAHGAAWRRTFWVGVRLVGCVRLSQDACDLAEERGRYEEQYDRMMERVQEIAWQREEAAQELRKQREAAAAALEQAKTEAAAMIERERIAAEATLRRIEADLEQTRVEAETSLRLAEEARRQAVEVATIEGRSAAELARLNNEHELKKIDLETVAKVRVAELEGQAKIAVARSETEGVRARAATDERVARIRRNHAIEVERVRQQGRQ